MRTRGVALIICLWGTCVPSVLGQSSGTFETFFVAPPSVEQEPSQPAAVWLNQPGTSSDLHDDMPQPDGVDAGPGEAGSSNSGFDSRVVARGQAAFQESCTQCHDAERSLDKRKSRSSWLSTVRRMARMDGADINSSDFVAIATYLASRNPATSSDGGTMEELVGDLGSSLSVSATISTMYRGGNDVLENPGFFVDAWLTADWQPSGPIRGRVTSCTSCHSSGDGDNGGFTLELVEAAAALDLMYWAKEGVPAHCHPQLEAELKAGRFIVPFGAFAAMSHPGVYRTLTNPLMYDMGRAVSPTRSQPPVLPAPYSDEGADLSVKVPLLWNWNATANMYAVNGLQGNVAGVQFTPSRSYTDNNSEPGYGGRVTVGNGRLRFGGSVMSGYMQDDIEEDPLQFRLAGGDVTAKLFDDVVRLYFEYAMRQNDTGLDDNQLAYGTVTEMEVLLLSDPNISFLGRYDTLDHRGFFGDRTIERYTWGVNTTAIGSSLLIINHEHWNFPHDETNIDVFGFRWVGTF